MIRFARRGLLVAAAATIVLGVSVYVAILPFISDTHFDGPDW
jgi:hypothetical protein